MVSRWDKNSRIYISDTTFTKKLPVIFFIHGGGFYSGSGNIYGPELLLDHDVILVTFNYRLGPFGFLSLNQNYSGNLALKDQLLALKWVRDNIRSFGGDKDRITIHGWSAGCWSVSLHMVSPASQGLFNRAICFSASALVPWILSYVKDHREIAETFAISNGVHPTNDQQLIDYLKNVDADQLAALAYTDFYTAGTIEKAIKLPWVPVVECNQKYFVSIFCNFSNWSYNNFSYNVCRPILSGITRKLLQSRELRST